MSPVGSWTDAQTDGRMDSLPAPLGAVHMSTGSTDPRFWPAFSRSRRIHWIHKVQTRTLTRHQWMDCRGTRLCSVNPAYSAKLKLFLLRFQKWAVSVNSCFGVNGASVL